MLIANPIYDVVFKSLMEDERTAKFFIGTLLGQSITEVVVKPQELTYINQLAGLAVFRLDFIATIKTDEGEYKKVLVEIQKAKNIIDLRRFRRYLASQYTQEDIIDGVKTSLPIVTIYLLGFNLPDIETEVLRVNRQYWDVMTNQVIEKKSDFVERLTHDCFVVQFNRIKPKFQTKLEKLLSVFEQNYFLNDNTVKEYKYSLDDDDLAYMIQNLHYAGTEPKEREKLETEREAWRTVDAMFEEKSKDLIDQLAKKEQAINEHQKVMEETQKKLQDQNKLIEELKRKLQGE